MLAIGTSAFDPISAATAARELPVGVFCKIRSSCAIQCKALSIGTLWGERAKPLASCWATAAPPAPDRCVKR